MQQGAEDIPDCMKRNLVYENICRLCNPGAKRKGDLTNINTGVCRWGKPADLSRNVPRSVGMTIGVEIKIAIF